jgi:quinoprotein glucose dehydrogenase
MFPDHKRYSCQVITLFPMHIKSWIYVVFFLVSFACGNKKDTSHGEWTVYRGGKDAAQFSELDQINVKNIHLLEPAWIFNTGDGGEKTTIECNPIIIGRTMYITSPALALIALDAATGKELWRFDPFAGETAVGVNRGVTYFKDGEKETLFLPAGSYLYAVNAQTGKLQADFGNQGKIDLRENLGMDPERLSIGLSTPGIIYQDLIIIGSTTGEGYTAAPGHVRAFNAKTGEFAWIFHTIPQENQFGHDTWNWIAGENYGGANNWAGMSLDENKGWVFVSTGSAVYDFYGANRLGENLYANSIIALNASSGEKIWHYQAVHHDLWDVDLPCAPTLISIPWEGGWKEALAQPTKMGELIILDRNTGETLLSSEESPVPGSNVPGELAHPTQKLNQGIPLVTMGLDPEKLTDISPESNEFARKELAKYRNEGIYTPPSMEGTIAFPGPRGGALWGGASYDSKNNMMYLNLNEIPMILQLAKVDSEGSSPQEALSGYGLYMTNCSNCHGAERQGMMGSFPALTGIENRLDKSQIIQILSKGKGVMPAFPQFTEAELEKLAAYLLEGKTENRSPETPKIGLDKYVLQGFRIFTDQDGFPANKAPWGTLTAVDLATFSVKWKVPLGYYPALREKGILEDTGTMNYGGCVATAGGLVFVGATADELFRAFDADSGKELWSYKLPAGGYAVPSVYEVDGKQYVVIAAGGGNRMGTPSGDAFIAFSLPDGKK